MALGDCFPMELINTIDLRIERVAFSDDWSDVVASPRTVIGENLPAIVVPSRQVFTQDVDAESNTQLTDVTLSPLVALSGTILEKDLVSWTPRDFGPAVVDAQVEEIEYVSGVDGLEHILLRVGRRIV